ncbi:MAG TPA: response regulator [Bacteroidota bacterium]|nr:response regulator [Bacteroidota bacterium]
MTLEKTSAMILVIETDPLMRDMLHHFLVDQGYQVIPAPNEREAIEKVRQYGEAIRVVISDVEVRDRGDVWAFQIIKETSPSVQFIVTSTFLNPHAREILKQEGVQHILQKPYTPDEILSALRELFQ